MAALSNTNESCPTRDELAGFLVGEIDSAADLRRIDEHLAECDACLDRLQAISDEGDPLLRALRRPSSLATYEAEGGCEVALQRVRRIALRGGEPKAGESAPTSVEPNSLGDTIRDEPGALRPRRLGVYELLEPIRSGGMGTLYRARHMRLKRFVALKMLTPARWDRDDSRQRFHREMEAIGRITHPHIVTAFDAGEEAGHPFLVMELLEGEDLAALARRWGKLPVADACEMIRQAALGLQYTHQQGVIHRDIKPANLMLAVGTDAAGEARLPPTVKVLDLGLARFAEPVDLDEMTSTGQLMGTVDYMSPEQALDSSQVDPRSDIYSLGATLFRLLTGRGPWEDRRFRSTGRKLQALMSEPLPSVAAARPDLPEALVAVVDRMLQHDRERRFSTALEVAESLLPFTEGHDLRRLISPRENSEETAIARLDQSAANTLPASSSAPTDDDERAAKSRERRSRTWPLLLGLLGMAAIMAAGVFWLQTDGGYVRIEAEPGIDVSVQVLRDGQAVEAIEVGRSNNRVWYRTGQYEIRLPADAATDFQLSNHEFTVTRGGKQPVVAISRVSNLGDARGTPTNVAATAAAEPSVDPEPTAVADAPLDQAALAKQLLACGAGVKLLDLATRRSGDYLSDVAQLPSEPSALSGLSLTDDFDVRAFSMLGPFALDSPKAEDEFNDERVKRLVDWLAQCTDLADLTFQRGKAEQVTDEAAAAFARLASLERIFLNFPHLTDQSVTYLGGLPKLHDIWLVSPRLTDQVWGELARIESLKTIRVSAAGSGDHRLLQGHGAGQLADHPNLKSLNIEACKWSSDGMSEIAKLTRLEALGFAFVPITDEDLLRFQSLDGLRSLELFETNVTADGVAALREKLPNCRITVPSR